MEGERDGEEGQKKVMGGVGGEQQMKAMFCVGSHAVVSVGVEGEREERGREKKAGGEGGESGR